MQTNKLKPTNENQVPAQKLIFTDLDGSLLDCDTHSWEPAKSALLLAAKKKIPIIPCSSKTFEECLHVQNSIGLTGPFIFENGTGIAFPQSSFNKPSKFCNSALNGYWLCSMSKSYEYVRLTLEDLRNKNRFRFRGFGDMTLGQIMEAIGGDAEAAKRAKMRRHSEPLIWLDGAKEFDRFHTKVTNAELNLTRGGRFVHVSGAGDKGTGMLWLAKVYARKYKQIPHLIALGDSRNDEPMLKAAHTAVIIRPAHTTPIGYIKKPSQQVINTKLNGPAGWGEAIHSLLDEESPSNT